MKKLMILSGLLLSTTLIPAKAQSTSDMIRQLLLDVEKLGQLKAILQDMYKGYEILDKGYTEIRDLARQRFNLHKVFLDGLLAINPSVSGHPGIALITDNEWQIVKEYKAAGSKAHNSGVFSVTELAGIDATLDAIYNSSLHSMDELTTVLTAGRLRMDDAQRIRVVDKINRDTDSQLSALRQLNDGMRFLVTQRLKEKNDLHTLKKIYDIP